MSATRGQCDADLRLPSQPQGIAARWLVPNYDRHVCVNNLPRVALGIGSAGIQTHDLLIASPAPYRCATQPLVEHAETNVYLECLAGTVCDLNWPGQICPFHLWHNRGPLFCLSIVATNLLRDCSNISQFNDIHYESVNKVPLLW